MRFATGSVTPGEFEFIHVNIDPPRSNVVVGGLEKRLRVPSEEIKIWVGFSMDENRVTSLMHDFDAKASLNARGNDEWLLQPVIIVSAGDDD